MLLDTLLFAAFILLLMLSAFFSGTETAFTAINDKDLAEAEKKHDHRAARVRELITDKGRIIAGLLVGNNIVNTILPVLATVLSEQFVLQVTALPSWTAPLVATVTSIFFLLIFGEVIPKNLAVVFFRPWALIAARPVGILLTIFSPIISLLNALSRSISSALGRTDSDHKPYSLQELMWFTRASQQSGTIDALEAKLMDRASVLNDHDVREIMVPRQEICMISAKATLPEIRSVFSGELYSRLPVYGESQDAIIGVLHFKQVFAIPLEHDSSFSAVSLMQAPFFVPETRTIGSLMEDMRKGGEHLAVVVDEFGALIGIITLEDILEFLIGAISDEFDPRAQPPSSGAPSVPDAHLTRFEISGRMPIVQFKLKYEIPLSPELVGDATTMAGLFLHHSGSLPKVGDLISLDQIRMRILRVSNHRIDRLEITRHPNP